MEYSEYLDKLRTTLQKCSLQLFLEFINENASQYTQELVDFANAGNEQLSRLYCNICEQTKMTEDEEVKKFVDSLRVQYPKETK